MLGGGLLASCSSGLSPNAVALAIEPLRSTPDSQATAAVATFAAALATSPRSMGGASVALLPTWTPTPTPPPTLTPAPTTTPDVAATETALQAQIQAAVAATLAAQPTATAQATPIAAAALPDVASTLGGMQMIAIVDGDGPVNLRSGPSTDYLVLTGVDSGAEVLIMGRNQSADWLYIRTANGTPGWMSALYVSTAQAPQSYPIVEPAPLPGALVAPPAGRP